MSVNYTDEQVEKMKEWYTAEPTRETVEKLSMELNKSIKTIIGKDYPAPIVVHEEARKKALSAFQTLKKN